MREGEKPDIWPQLITKALAKEMVNYERVTLQTSTNLLRDITGKPTRSYQENWEIDWNTIKECYARNYIFMAQGNFRFNSTFIGSKKFGKCWFY